MALIALCVINADAWFGWLDDHQPVWTAVAAFVVPATIIAAYLATGTRGLARIPIDFLVGRADPDPAGAVPVHLGGV